MHTTQEDQSPRSGGSHQDPTHHVASDSPVLAARGISKAFGSVVALEGVDFELRVGEVVALVGDNGAGKSTLVSILSGVTQPLDGSLFLDGKPIRFANPLDARDHGIVTVFQDLALVEARDVAFNLYLGVEPRRWGFVLDRKAMYRDAKRVLKDLSVNVPNAHTPVRSLSGGQRQAVAVARTVARGCRVVMLDEPTAALGVRESRKVLDLVCQLKSSGHAVLIISHNMETVLSVADRVVVLRLGRVVANRMCADCTMSEIVAHVVGVESESR